MMMWWGNYWWGPLWMGLGWLLPLVVLVLVAAVLFRGLAWGFGGRQRPEDRELREDLQRLSAEIELLREEIRRVKNGGRGECKDRAVRGAASGRVVCPVDPCLVHPL